MACPGRNLALVAGILLVGCGRAAPPSPPTVTEVMAVPVATLPNTPAGAWVMDLDRMAIPDHPARGTLAGRPFAPDQFILAGDTLTLRQGNEFEADLEMTINLFPGESPTILGSEITILGEGDIGKDPSAHVHLSHRSGEALPATKIFMEGIALRLRLGDVQNGKVSGGIYLCLLDRAKSHVVGKFVAAVVPSTAVRAEAPPELQAVPKE